MIYFQLRDTKNFGVVGTFVRTGGLLSLEHLGLAQLVEQT